VNTEVDLSEFWGQLAQLPTLVSHQLSLIVDESAHEAQGVAPVRSGDLRQSIFARQAAGGQSFELGAAVRYAPYVFFGTRRMKGRPFLQIALARNLRQLGQRIEQQQQGAQQPA
jgi:hypothetical protein